MTSLNYDNLVVDYLVIGAGAVGMAFVDTLLDESDATVLMVDDHHQPGGHWNDAYPFVRLHQPSHFYGVASTPLGSKSIDQSGFNAGYFELAGLNEIQSYFEQVMRQRFLPSGRVTYLPMCTYLGENRIRRVLSGEEQRVTVNKRVVDTTYFETSVPMRHEKNYQVADDVVCIPPNHLPIMGPAHPHYCIVGAGKTAMDTGVWLLDNGVDPQHISWVCPRQSWLMNREVTQASVEFFVASIGGFANQLEAIAQAQSVEDCFDRLEACGYLLRIDESQRPKMFHFATISRNEVQQLRRIEQVIRQGRIASIDQDGLIMQDGTRVALPSHTLYVDCTASAVDFKSTRKRPVFEEQLITIQALRAPNPCLSAALTAFVEFNYGDDAQRNRLCQPVPLPDDEVGWLYSMLGNMTNQGIWSTEPKLQEFIAHCRLDGFGSVIREVDMSRAENAAVLEKLGANAGPALENLQRLIEQTTG